ncbi:MAG: hypothetical protein H7249_16005 [Chitinophagaceae bacterium]|nr:hypothetical protein [Oligoflexus sp.]
MKLIQLSLLTILAFACQGPAPTPETGATSTTTAAQSSSGSAANAKLASASSNVSESSEGVVGPDEAFFAGVYLESVFNASKSNPHPTVSVRGASLASSGTVEAFDFAANLQPKRLELMSSILLKLGDKDGDKNLSFEEFSALKLSPDLKGAAGSVVPNGFDKETFDAAAGDDDLLSAIEIKALLTSVASESSLAKLTKNENRKTVVSDWEKVLKAYDADGDGKLSLDEQAQLRKDRALILAKFSGQ